MEPLENTGISIAVTITDSRGVPHEQRRQLKGKRREVIGEDLLTRKVAVWHNEAAKNMKYGDPVPPYLPHKETLRKCKEQAVTKILNLQEDADVINSLRIMKIGSEYGGSMKQIGADRFFCMYWSPLQIANYKNVRKSQRKLEIDATGNFSQAISITDSPSNVSYLYQIVMPAETGTAPVAQMVAEKHDTNMIHYWLEELLKEIPAPIEAVSDYSLALLNAMTLSFNKRTLKVYVAECFSFLHNVQHDKALPSPIMKTFIRVDIAHLMNILCKKHFFDKKSPALKDFYARCLGLMTICIDTKAFKQILKYTLVAAMSDCPGINDGVPLYSEQKENWLLEKIKSYKLNEDDNIDRDSLPDCEELEENGEISEYIDRIHRKAQERAETCKGYEKPNPFYLPDIVPIFLKLAKQFPLWTNVMLPYFPKANQVATSSRIEGYFKDLKAFLGGKAYKPLRADKVIAKHIRWIENSSKLERAAVKNKNAKKNLTKERKTDRKEGRNIKEIRQGDAKEEECEKEEEEVEEDSYLKWEERWRGKNPKIVPIQEGDISESVDAVEDSSKLERAAVENRNAKNSRTKENKKRKTDRKENRKIKKMRRGDANEEKKEEDVKEDSYTHMTYWEWRGKDTKTVPILQGDTSESYKVAIENWPENSLEFHSKDIEKNCHSTTIEPIEPLEPTEILERKVGPKDPYEYEKTYKENINPMGILKELPNKYSIEAKGRNILKENNQQTQKQRGKYLRPCPDIKQILNRPVQRHRNAFLRNGSFSGLVEIDGTPIFVKNTCPFDSFIEVVSNAYADNTIYKNAVDASAADFLINSFIRRYVTKGVTKNLYTMRATVLSRVFNLETTHPSSGNKQQEQKHIMNCTDNVCGTIRRLYKDVKGFATCHENVTCNCGESTNDIEAIEIRPELMWSANDIAEGIRDYVNEYFQDHTRICSRCESPANIHVTPGIHIILDSEFAFRADVLRDNLKNAKKLMSLDDAPQFLHVRDARYMLNGVVAFFNIGDGHYKAFSRRISGTWVLYDDIHTKPIMVKNYVSKKVNPGAIIYTKVL